MRHIGGTLPALRTRPGRYEALRVGIALYGVRPDPSIDTLPLVPAMRLVSRVVAVRDVAAGQGVSYDYT